MKRSILSLRAELTHFEKLRVNPKLQERLKVRIKELEDLCKRKSDA